MLLGGTLTALVAAALVGLMTSALLYVANNSEDFQVLFDVSNVIKEKLADLKRLSKEFGEEYREKKLEEAKEI
jgi:hypothetical protein